MNQRMSNLAILGKTVNLQNAIKDLELLQLKKEHNVLELERIQKNSLITTDLDMVSDMLTYFNSLKSKNALLDNQIKEATDRVYNLTNSE